MVPRMEDTGVDLVPVGASRASATAPYRQAPANEEAEQALLGAILVNNRAFEKIAEFLKGDHFYDPAHGRIYGAIQKLLERNQIANPVTLKAYFEQDGDLADVGGAEYLARLAGGAVSIIDAEHYGRAIHDAFLRRALIELGEDMVNEAYRHDLDVAPADQIEDAEKRLFDLATVGDFEGGFVPFSQSLEKAIAMAEKAFRREGKITGVTTGLTDMDRKLGGLQNSDLLILAARPSMGKTTLAVNIAFNAAKAYLRSGGKEGAVVGFFSLEMSAEQLAARILSDEAQVPSENLRRGELRESDFAKFVEATQLISRAPFFVDDTPALSITAVRTRARRLKRQHNLGLLVVDYLQLLRGGGSRQSEANRVQEISEITRGLKAIAKELDIPVIALSQLSRAVESRDDKRPQLSDLRESGSIEQDADIVMFIFREQYYLERGEPSRKPDEGDDKFNERYERWKERLSEVYNTAEVIIAKQRHGPIGSVRLFFDGQYTRFSDLETQHGGDFE